MLAGATVGHRSLQRYYRQKLKPESQRSSQAVSKVITQYKALGWTGTRGMFTTAQVTEKKSLVNEKCCPISIE